MANMGKASPRSCPVLELHEWSNTRGWQYRVADLHTCLSSQNDDLVSREVKICLVFADALEVRECDPCKSYFIEKFSMPKQWWTNANRKSNGYFGSHATAQYIGTWVYFEMKLLDNGTKYKWYKLNVHVRWDRATQRTIVVLFDTPQVVKSNILHQLASFDPDSMSTPFWFYPYVVGEMARIQERAVWAIRDQVRAVETKVMPTRRPDPDYRALHDIARHGIHVTETLDVAVETMKRILSRHEGVLRLLAKEDGSEEIPSNEVHSQLEFTESFIASLRYRSISNDKRLANEIQLAFNTVAQHDASMSVKVAVVALIFLPPTFVSAIFSMSFFNFSPEGGWIVSDKFWLYWAFAVPITIATAIAWYAVQRYGVPELSVLKSLFERAEKPPQKLSV